VHHPGTVSKGTIKSVGDVILCLEEILAEMQNHKIYNVIIQQFFVQIFYVIGTETFNAILENSRYCTYQNGFQIKSAIAQLQSWIASKSSILAVSKTR